MKEATSPAWWTQNVKGRHHQGAAQTRTTQRQRRAWRCSSLTPRDRSVASSERSLPQRRQPASTRRIPPVPRRSRRRSVSLWIKILLGERWLLLQINHRHWTLRPRRPPHSVPAPVGIADGWWDWLGPKLLGAVPAVATRTEPDAAALKEERLSGSLVLTWPLRIVNVRQPGSERVREGERHRHRAFDD